MPPSTFEKELIELNPQQLSELQAWVLFEGMLFGSLKKWWEKGGLRSTPHEGLDIVCFKDKKGRMKFLSEDTIIPAPFEGVVLSVKKDFIGTSVFVTLAHKPNVSILWAVGHIILYPHIKVGKHLNRGTPLGTIAPLINKKDGLFPHLHISIGFCSPEIKQETIDWIWMAKNNSVKLIDPLPHLLITPYEVLRT